MSIIVGRPIQAHRPDPLALGKELSGDQLRERFNQLVSQFRTRDPLWARFIIIGAGKSGKTFACVNTLPTPILAMLFDPNSEQLIPDDMIDKGLILPIRYYGDDPESPTAYANWEQDVLRWRRDGFMNAFASVMLDSFSSLIVAQLRQIAANDKSGKRRSLMPQLQDYNVLKVNTLAVLVALCSIPCHLVLNAHILEERVFRDEQDLIGTIRRTLNATPSLQANVPALFSEVYLAECVTDKQGTQFVWITQKNHRYPDLPLGSRMSRPGHEVPAQIPQDFRALLKEYGFHWEDKQPINQPN